MNTPVLFSFMLVYNSKNWDTLFSFSNTVISENKDAISFYHLIPYFERGDSINFVLQTSAEKVDILAKNINDSFCLFFENNKSETPEIKKDSNPYLLNYPNNSILYFQNPGFYATSINIAGAFRIIEKPSCYLFQEISNLYMFNVIDDTNYATSWSKCFDVIKYMINLMKFSTEESKSTIFSNILNSLIQKEKSESIIQVLHQKFIEIKDDLNDYVNNIDSEIGDLDMIVHFFKESKDVSLQELSFIIQSVISIFGLSSQDIIYTSYFAEQSLLKIKNN